jgi:hypothetical protein
MNPLDGGVGCALALPVVPGGPAERLYTKALPVVSDPRGASSHDRRVRTGKADF